MINILKVFLWLGAVNAEDTIPNEGNFIYTSINLSNTRRSTITANIPGMKMSKSTDLWLTTGTSDFMLVSSNCDPAVCVFQQTYNTPSVPNNPIQTNTYMYAEKYLWNI